MHSVPNDNGFKVIEDIEVGDYVLARNEETGETAYKEVEDTFQREAEETYHITVKDTTFITTQEHPFWVDGLGWVVAGDLKVGDILIDNEGVEYPIKDIEIVKEKRTVYNFTVTGYHNYFVTELSIWTHNCSRDMGAASRISIQIAGGKYPSRVTIIPPNVKVGLPKNVTQFQNSIMQKWSTNKGTGNVTLSNGNISHFWNGHSFEPFSKQVPYLLKVKSRESVEKQLSDISFFNK